MTIPPTTADPAQPPAGQERALDFVRALSGLLDAPLSIHWGPTSPESTPCSPFRLGGRTVGWLRGPESAATPTADLQRWLDFAADVLGTILTEEDELIHRVSELAAVYRVSAALAGLASVQEILECALRVVIQVMQVDAGSIRLLDENTGVLVPTAWMNLSEDYRERGPVFAADSELDQAALAGEVVYVEDLRTDDRVRFPDLVESERLRSFLCTGIMFRGKAVGVMRLFTRSVRRFDPHERDLLRLAAQQIAVAVVNARLIQERRAEREMKRQLRLATDVQKRMLPQKLPSLPTIEFAARYLPSRELGGDFFDFIALGQSVGLALGDVVGKGIPAALLMASVRASLRAHALDLYDLDGVMARTNRALVQDTLEEEFATLWYGVFDPMHARLTYANAGHERPWIFRRSPGGTIETSTLDVGGMALGIDPTERYEKGIFHLRPDDVLVVYSDGLTDVMNFEGRRFGKDAAQQAVRTYLAEHADATAQGIVDHVYWEARRFLGFNEQPDDITIVVARCRSRGETGTAGGI